MMSPLSIRAYTATTPLGAGCATQIDALRAGRSGLRKARFGDATLECWIGEVQGLDRALPAALSEWDCRNNRLSALALAQDGFSDAVAAAVARYRADRIGVFVGTSTSGVYSTELAYREVQGEPPLLPPHFIHRTTHNPQAAAEFVRVALGLQNIAMAICTAGSSSGLPV